MITSIPDIFIAKIHEKEVDFSTDTIKCCFTKDTLSFDKTTHSYYNNISGEIVPFTNGHEQKTLQNITKTVVANEARYSYDDVLFQAVSGEIQSVGGILFFDDSVSQDPIAAHVTFDSSLTINEGRQFAIYTPRFVGKQGS